eukprot:TRINITY_DN1817_c0_g2_i1.p1 TRINITY_DN1817_c0_g2~~TRINITY_DN1817_c0_g2_i1.p1  ORF type:complete len:440 (-),score=67.70 TRINITY_DN1817_c0_g2_i1:13-1332(-)
MAAGWKTFEEYLKTNECELCDVAANSEEKREEIIQSAQITDPLQTGDVLKKWTDQFPIQQSVQSGWLRDLTAEGVESNPGPGWKKLISAVSEEFEDPPKEVVESLKKNLGKPDLHDYQESDFTNLLQSKTANEDNQLSEVEIRLVNAILKTSFPQTGPSDEITAKLHALELALQNRQSLNFRHRENFSKSSVQKNFRKKVIHFYQRRFGKTKRCMVTNQSCNSQNSRAAHLWPVEHASRIGEILEMSIADVGNPRNGILVLKTIEEAFDRGRCTFIYHPLQKQLLFKIIDPDLRNDKIFGNTSFSEFNEKPLHHPANRMPFLRVLSYLSREYFNAAIADSWIDRPEWDQFKTFDELYQKGFADESEFRNHYPVCGNEYTAVGTPVWAFWLDDKKHYEATIQKKNEDGTFKVNWRSDNTYSDKVVPYFILYSDPEIYPPI